MTEQIDALHALLRSAPPSPGLRDAFAALRREEIEGSSRLAGAALDRGEVRTLLERGRAAGGHPLDHYLIVRDYGDALTWAAHRAVRRDPIALEDVRVLHRRAVRGLRADGGVWRTGNLPALPDGTVPPPHWLVPFETEAFAGRLALDETAPVPFALARAVSRLVRLRPFATANGRVARLLANLLLFRRGLPPLALDARARRAYLGAIRAADAGQIAPLARVIGVALVRSLERARDALEAPEGLAPLSSFASGTADALYKAAQRGTLRVVRRAGRLYTTQQWIDDYRR